MKALGMLIKPVSGGCNMNCRYCFYADVANSREVQSYGAMTLQTLQTLVQKVFSGTWGAVSFMFQGGEPTLRGLGFYRRLVEYVAEYNIKKIPVSYGIQTNGHALDEEWAKFLADNRFLAGVSLDGTKEIHNRSRLDRQGNDTHSTVMRTIRLFKKYGVEFNILTVVTAEAARHIDSIYSFYKKNGLRYLQFIPCIDDFDAPWGERPYSLTPALYETVLKRLFDYWYQDVLRGDHTYIRFFDSLLFRFAGRKSPDCGMNGRCENQMVIEADGSVYPCDFYVVDRYRIGNLLTDNWDEILRYGETGPFILESEQINKECKSCRWYSLCMGGCRRYRQQRDTLGLFYFCEAYKGFFEYAADRMLLLANQTIRQRQAGKLPG